MDWCVFMLHMQQLCACVGVIKPEFVEGEERSTCRSHSAGDQYQSGLEPEEVIRPISGAVQGNSIIIPVNSLVL